MRTRRKSEWFPLCGSLLLVATLAGCGGGGGGNGGGIVDPADSDSVTSALGVKFGNAEATVVDGDPPGQDSEAAGNPVVNVVDTQDTKVTPGQTKEITYSADTSDGAALSVLYAKITGSSSYFRADASQAQALGTKQSGVPTLALDIPENLGAGEFCVQISVQDAESRISNADEICFQSVPEENSSAAALERLQGNWERCDDAELERLAIDGERLEFVELEYENADCSGEVLSAFSDTLRFTVGNALSTDSGLIANELDLEVIDSPNEQDIGTQAFGIFRVDGDQLFINAEDASSPENRPTALDLQNPYSRVEDGNAEIVGAWKIAGADENDLLLLNFLPNGHYTHAEVDFDDQSDPSGMEWGVYSRDAGSGRMTVRQRFDTNGAAGLSDFSSGDAALFAEVIDGQLILRFDESGNGQIDGDAAFSGASSSGVAGLWLVSGPNENDLLLFNFLDDGTYVHYEVDDDDPEEISGMEWGDYVLDPASDSLTVSGRFDANGSTGLSDAYDPPPNLFLSVSGDLLSLEVDENGDQQIDNSVNFDRQ